MRLGFRPRTIVHLPGYFQHEEQPEGPDSGFRATTLPSHGLLPKAYPTDADFDPHRQRTQWERFSHYLHALNKADPLTRYKLIFVQRHGEGAHNVKEAAVGRSAWESHWARLSGDGETTWDDANLTVEGAREAAGMKQFWQTAITNDKMPLPDRYYSSPLRRCIQTAEITYRNLVEETGNSFSLTVSEGLREVYGIHTCDRHGSRDSIANAYPFVTFMPDMPAEDDQWKADARETTEAATSRLREWVHTVFEQDSAVFISASTHSGAIRALYRAVGHPDVWVGRGAIVPLLIEATSTIRD